MNPEYIGCRKTGTERLLRGKFSLFITKRETVDGKQNVLQPKSVSKNTILSTFCYEKYTFIEWSKNELLPEFFGPQNIYLFALSVIFGRKFWKCGRLKLSALFFCWKKLGVCVMFWMYNIAVIGFLAYFSIRALFS